MVLLWMAGYFATLLPIWSHQIVTVFSIGLDAHAKEPAAAKALAQFLTAPAALPVIRKHGLEPA